MGEILGIFRSKGLGRGSPNQAWNSKVFQAYADHTFSIEFQEALNELIERSKTQNLAIMWAERFFWECHRRIICDWILAKGKKVVYILNDEKREHELTSFAKMKEGKVLNQKDD